MNKLRKTFLVERSKSKLLFKTESAPIVKGLLLVVIIGVFLISLKASFSTALPFRFSIIGICLIGFLIMGSRSTVTLDSQHNRIRIDNAFYFYRKQTIHSFKEISDVSILPSGDGFQVMLKLEKTLQITLGSTTDQEEADIWQKVIQEFIG